MTEKRTVTTKAGSNSASPDTVRDRKRRPNAGATLGRSMATPGTDPCATPQLRDEDQPGRPHDPRPPRQRFLPQPQTLGVVVEPLLGVGGVVLPVDLQIALGELVEGRIVVVVILLEPLRDGPLVGRSKKT